MSRPALQQAMRRYLQTYGEPDLPLPPTGRHWHHVLVMPVYREPASVLAALQCLDEQCLKTNGEPLLVIVVMNRPDSDRNSLCNQSLRNAILALPMTGRSGAESEPEPIAAGAPARRLYQLSANIDLLLYDLEREHGPTPAAQGVGLARKAGCDIALSWGAAGCIASDWICTTDADARLPADYFQRLPGPAVAGPSGLLNATAATYPFQHLPGGEPAVDRATALYELRLHYYVLGLEHAGSPYAQHTLGSCIAVRALPYAQVRGFPRRAGGEDFYLLNKLAKLGTVQRLGGNCIALRSRSSSRAPFGTGPAVAQITAEATAEPRLFYHPQAFEALRVLLASVPEQRDPGSKALAVLLYTRGLSGELAAAAAAVALGMGWEKSLLHCRRHGKTAEQFLRQFHQWFDGFRTLKFIHGLRAAGWADQSLSSLPALQPNLWPHQPARRESTHGMALLDAVQAHWHWRSPPANLFSEVV